MNLEFFKKAATTGWYKKLFKYLLTQHNIYLVEGMYDSLQSIILEWICTPIMFPSHTASYLKCTTVLLLAVLNGLSKLTPTVAAHKKAFQKGIGNVLVWEDIIALAPSFPFFYLVKWLLFWVGLAHLMKGKIEIKKDGSTTIFIKKSSVLFFGIYQFTWERLDVNKRHFVGGTPLKFVVVFFVFFIL